MTKRFNHHYFTLLSVMTKTEFMSRYKRAIFGFLWLFLNPLFQMLIIGTVFSHFISLPNYYLFLFGGLLLWQFFSSSITKSTYSFVSNRNLLQKTPFPLEIIPISIILADYINLLFSLLLFLTTTAFVTGLSLKALLIIPILLWLLTFSVAFSLITSTLNVRFRDTNFFVNTLLMLWFYATPILYQTNSLPGFLQKYLIINPLASLFSLFHYIFFNAPFPNTILIITNLFTTIVILFLGIFLFRKNYSYFVDWL